MSVHESKIHTVSIEKLTKPFDGARVIKDHWWITRNGEALFYRPHRRYEAPQCNHDERVARHLAAKLYPDAEVTFVPLAFVEAYDE